MEGLADLYNILKSGGPYGIIALVFTWGYLERKERQDLSKQLYDLATQQITASLKTESSLSSLKDLISQLSNRL
jgi:hypothetical protein